MGMTRRSFLTAAAVPLLSAFQGKPMKKRMGACIASYPIRSRAGGFKDAISFLDHVRSHGGGGIQTGVAGWDEPFARKLRDTAGTHGMYLEGQIGLPKDEADVARFEGQVRVAKAAGIALFRVVLHGGRRYEAFDTAAQFKEFRERSVTRLKLAQDVARREKARIAYENHKEFRAAEMLEFLDGFDREHVAACLDLGNNISLLEEPMSVIEALAPRTISVHIKDMAVQECPDGFLLSEVPLGEGLLDLAKIREICDRANPDVRYSLEMLTRDPLVIPCRTKKYWATFGGAPGPELEAMLTWVRANPPKKPLPRITGLSQDQQIALEDDLNRRSFAYATGKLGL